MDIRLATVEDAPAIKRLDEVTRISPQRDRFIDRAIADRRCFVAALENRVVGYAVFNYSFYERGFVALLYVDRRHRRRRIGSSLLDHFAQMCETPTLFTSTNQSNTAMQETFS